MCINLFFPQWTKIVFTVPGILTDYLLLYCPPSPCHLVPMPAMQAVKHLLNQVPFTAVAAFFNEHPFLMGASWKSKNLKFLHDPGKYLDYKNMARVIWRISVHAAQLRWLSPLDRRMYHYTFLLLVWPSLDKPASCSHDKVLLSLEHLIVVSKDLVFSFCITKIHLTTLTTPFVIFDNLSNGSLPFMCYPHFHLIGNSAKKC